MILSLIAWAAALFLIARFLVTCSNVIWSPVLSEQMYTSQPLISVLIPARNEEENLPELLSALSKNSYSNIEILVYDDKSTDQTADIIKTFAKRDHRIKYLEGLPLPEGWIGKPHACHQLASRARGDYFLFIDADIKLYDHAIESALAYLKSKNLVLLSVFPVQEMRSFGERLTVPLMNWILLGLLPMRLILSAKAPSLAAANGQFMLFESHSYQQNKWHRQVCMNIVEDIAIIKKMKTSGYRVDTRLGNPSIRCGMYDGLKSGIKGFSKNMLTFFGGQPALLVVFMLLTTFAPLLCWLEWGVLGAAFYAGGVTIQRIFISLLSKQNVFMNILFIPLQHLSFLVSSLWALVCHFTKKYTWRGREILKPVKT